MSMKFKGPTVKIIAVLMFMEILKSGSKKPVKAFDKLVDKVEFHINKFSEQLFNRRRELGRDLTDSEIDSFFDSVLQQASIQIKSFKNRVQ